MKPAPAVKKQPWDPGIYTMAALPDLVKRLADDVQWTTDLGNAFLAQQSDVMYRAVVSVVVSGGFRGERTFEQ
jgi:hypothetical protein